MDYETIRAEVAKKIICEPEEWISRDILSRVRARKASLTLCSDRALETEQTRMSELLPKMYREKANARCVNAERTGVFADGRLENWLIYGENGICLPANLYLPCGGGKHPVVLLVCGHYTEGKAQPDYQYAAQRMAESGLAVLVIDAMGQGERIGYFDPETGENRVGVTTSEHSYNGNRAWLAGVPLGAYFVEELSVALDYLISRPDVDPQKIGLTGNSGGGLQTALMMAMQDPRVQAFAPATYMTDMASMLDIFLVQDDEQILYGMSAYGFDYDDFILSVAPKPVCILAVTEDFFPVDGAIVGYLRTKEVYRALGKSDSLKIVIDYDEHRYSECLANAAAKFFHNCFCPDQPFSNSFVPTFRTPEELWASPAGRLNGWARGGRSVAERIRADLCAPLPPDLSAFSQAVFYNRALPSGDPERVFDGEVNGGMRMEVYRFPVVESVDNVCAVFSRGEVREIEIWLLDRGTEDFFARPDLIGRVGEGRAVAVPDTCGYGLLKSADPGSYDRYGRMYNLTHHLFMLGDSMGAFRCFEMYQALESIQRIFGLPVSLFASGKIETLVCVVTALRGETCHYEGRGIRYREIAEGEWYEDDNIKPYLLFGGANIDFEHLKKMTERAE